MTDNDYLITAFGLFLKHYNKAEESLLDGNRLANFLTPIPSDAQHNFIMSNVVYKTTDLFQKDSKDNYKKDKKGNYVVNRNSVIYNQFLNIARKELCAMNTALNAIFIVDYDKNGVGIIRKENGKPVYYNGKTENQTLRCYKNTPGSSSEETRDFPCPKDGGEQRVAFAGLPARPAGRG